MPVCPTVKNPPGRPYSTFAGTVTPPWSGMNPFRRCTSLKIRSVSLPKKKPVGVDTIASTPLPRGLRTGFQLNGRPFEGSCAEKPVRTTPPGNGPVHRPQLFGLYGLFSHCW